MTDTTLSHRYRAYIDCLNARDWGQLANFIDENAQHNGRRLGLSGYRDMLIEDYEKIPDLRFNIQFLVCDPPRVAARLSFKCRPKGMFLGLKIAGRAVSFAENVFYEFKGDKIASVWSIVDKAAIEAQLLEP